MSAALQLIQQATACGVKLFNQNGELKYEAQSPLSIEFLSQLKNHKAELLDELQQRPMQTYTGLPPHTLLVRIANLLGVPKDSLLEQGLLEPCDLVEQAHTDPWVLAEGIRRDPRWIEQDDRKHSTPTLSESECSGRGEPEAHTTHWTAHIAPKEWTQARDAYLNHLAACPGCWAPIGRYCSVGTELQAQYQEAPV